MNPLRRAYRVLAAQIPQSAKKRYYKLHTSLPSPPENDRRWGMIRKLSSKRSPTVIDGGAHRGETIEYLKFWFDSPRIHAFEPNPSNFELLQDRYGEDDDIHLYNFAIGSETGSTDLNITRSSSGSSLLDPSEEYQLMWEGGTVEETVTVDVKPLDQVIDDDIDIIKLDLQGYEYFALKGSRELLKDVEVVSSETMFNVNYTGQQTFEDLDEILYKNGFKLEDFFNIKHWPDGQIRHADVVYKTG